MTRRRAPGPLAVAAALRRRALAAGTRSAAVHVRVYDAAGQATTLDPLGERAEELAAAADELIRLVREDVE